MLWFIVCQLRRDGSTKVSNNAQSSRILSLFTTSFVFTLEAQAMMLHAK